jgi:hypothetical protein
MPEMTFNRPYERASAFERAEGFRGRCGRGRGDYNRGEGFRGVGGCGILRIDFGRPTGAEFSVANCWVRLDVDPTAGGSDPRVGDREYRTGRMGNVERVPVRVQRNGVYWDVSRVWTLRPVASETVWRFHLKASLPD